MGALYRLDFPSGKSYIGVTMQTANKRFSRHVQRSKSDGTQAVHSAIRKYGAASVTVTTLVVADDREFLYELERRAIDAFETKSPGGYNLTGGGDGAFGYVFPADVKARMSTAQAEAWQRPAHRKQMCEGRLGRRASEATRKKRSKAIKERWADPTFKEMMMAARHRPLSGEARKKRSEALKASWAKRKAANKKEITSCP